MKRTNKQIINCIIAELDGMQGYSIEVIAKALNKRYHPEKIAQAVKEYKGVK